ncbi:MAG TPA: cytochrome c [Cyclobacteriaceae bacterium]|nr:cytochrome c [Cyclobacteriaceae bacterium]HRK52865.1 cytochrome c [Cyclobacteriaceae bacterium]
MKQIQTILCLLALTPILLSFQQDDELKTSMVRGKEIFIANCVTCHMQNGEGIEGVYPPLAKSDYLMSDKVRAIKQVLEGASGPMTVNGIQYNGFMAGFDLSDREVSDVLNYIKNSWGNKSEAITPEEVKSVR